MNNQSNELAKLRNLLAEHQELEKNYLVQIKELEVTRDELMNKKEKEGLTQEVLDIKDRIGHPPRVDYT
jgi:uncharacterized membrane protein YgaE (UPF0421/DUF939 family)